MKVKRTSLSEMISEISKDIWKRHTKARRRLSQDAGSVESNRELALIDDILRIEGLARNYEEWAEQRIAKLEKELSELKKRFRLDASNSHQSPSSQPHKKIKNSREKTARKPGGQPGHAGHARELESQVDRIHREEPRRCRSCQRDLSDVRVDEVVKKQEIDIRDGQVFVTEYQSVIKFCPDCGDMNRASPLGTPKGKVVFGNHAKSIALYLMVHQLLPVERTQEALRDLFGFSVSQGALCGFLRLGASRLLPWRRKTQAELIQAAVAHFDETGIRCEKRSDWIHVASTSELTLLSHSQKRGKCGSDEAGVLPYFKGTAVHDALSSYFRYDQCRHSLCHAHLIRELKYLHEEEAQPWALELERFLKKAIHRLKNRPQLPVSARLGLKKEFQAILRRGFQWNGYAQDWKRRQPDGFEWSWENGKRVKVPIYRQRSHSKAMQVLNRLRDYRDEFLRFIFDSQVPATNNQAERDLRMAKLKGKISGCFRSASAAENFLVIKSYLSTLRKQHKTLIPALRSQLAH